MNTATKTRREAWAAQFDRCMACGEPGRRASAQHPWGLQVHEILRRSQAPHGAAQFAANWLYLCLECHNEFDSASRWPLAKQLALKAIRDTEHYDLREWLSVKGRGRELPYDVWAADVAVAGASLRTQGGA